MTKKIFITGTGTDVGKTYISALIVKKMRNAGYNCGYFKPVISGVSELCGRLVDSDANYVVQFADIPIEAELCTSYFWQEAVSPHLAAKRKKQEIDINKILRLKSLFNDSVFPYKVDIIDLNSIDENFFNIIKDDLVKIN